MWIAPARAGDGRMFRNCKELPMKLSNLFAVAWILVCVAAAGARAQTQILTLPGASANDAFGRAVAAVGDVDGDGSDDFAIGAPLNDAIASNAGVVTVWSGR